MRAKSRAFNFKGLYSNFTPHTLNFQRFKCASSRQISSPLSVRRYPVPDREMARRGWDRATPIQTPTIAGGLFAIDRQFFYDLGSYDEGMQASRNQYGLATHLLGVGRREPGDQLPRLGVRRIGGDPPLLPRRAHL